MELSTTSVAIFARICPGLAQPTGPSCTDTTACTITPMRSRQNSEDQEVFWKHNHGTSFKLMFSGKCNHCKAVVKGGSFISHMGQVHNEVEKYLPDVCRIPASVQVR